MVHSIAHRGDCPPQSAQYGNVWLGCARLAIVGREHAHQPIMDSTAGVSLVFNGEIYNHRELNHALTGSSFSLSDTHVFLEGYKRWGIDIVEKLDGMFAFILHDSKDGVVFAARDPLGIKPLYYLRTSDAVYFGSEMKAILAVVPRDDFAAQIQAVRPGTVVRCPVVRTDSMTFTDYNSFPEVEIPQNEEAAQRKLRQLIRDSVWSMLDTDLPIGLLCSGGIDSSIVLYEALEYKKKKDPLLDLSVYCVGDQERLRYPRPDSPDYVYADYVYRELCDNLPASMKPEMHIVDITLNDVLKLIPEVIWAIETFEPNHIRAGIANLALLRRIRDDGIKIVLVGEGADELLGGYQEFAACVASGGYCHQLDQLFDTFTEELHKTQLKRVDRLSMACTIEARVPFLSNRLAAYSMALPNDWKVAIRGESIVTKGVLREAYRRLLPAVWNRRKVPMGEGAGVGDNRDGGHFYEHARKHISHRKAAEIIRTYEEYGLRNDEEVWYFQQYMNLFGPVRISVERPTTNLLPTESPYQ